MQKMSPNYQYEGAKYQLCLASVLSKPCARFDNFQKDQTTKLLLSNAVHGVT